jgi:hypothetical protein
MAGSELLAWIRVIEEEREKIAPQNVQIVEKV